MLHSYLGEFAALLTAICWTVSPIAFEYSGKRLLLCIYGSLKTGFGTYF